VVKSLALVVSVGVGNFLPGFPQEREVRAAEIGQQKPEAKKAKKRATKTWTNDDFPSGQLPEEQEPKEKAKEGPAPQAPPEKRNAFAGLEPEEVTALIKIHEGDLEGLEASLEETRNKMSSATSREERDQLVEAADRYTKQIEETKVELEQLKALESKASPSAGTGKGASSQSSNVPGSHKKD